MQTILAVRGVGNRGKTNSIKKLYQLLKDSYPKAVIEAIIVSIDITIIITIDGIKIGIESQGDPSSRLLTSLKRFVQVGCKVIVCATRSRGRTVQAVTDLAKQYQIKWFEKEYVSGVAAQDAANVALAQELLKGVQSAIKA